MTNQTGAAGAVSNAGGATDEARQWLAKIEPVVISLRERARPTHERWTNNYDAWRGRHNRSFFRSGTFNHYLPIVRLQFERFVTRTAQMLVPSPEFFEVFPVTEARPDLEGNAEAIRGLMAHVWTRRIKAYGFARRLVRCLGLYGRAIAKSTLKIERADHGVEIWPHARVIDPFHFYTFPENVTDLEEATCCFEDNMMAWETYQENVGMGFAEPIAQEDLTKPTWPEYAVRRLQAAALTAPTDVPNVRPDGRLGTQPMERFLAISEVYWKERPGAWRLIWVCWNLKNGPRVVRVSPKTRRRPPYRMAMSRDLPGEAYGTCMMDDLEPSQVLFNDQINLTLEGHALSFMPPAAIDPDMVTRASTIVWKPRAKWLMKPDGLKWLQVPDTTATGYRGVQFTAAFIQQATSGGGLAEGNPVRNLPRGSMAVSSLLNLATADQRDMAQIIEDEILSPLCSDLYLLAKDFTPREQIYRIPGTHKFPGGLKVSPQQMQDDWAFQWVGSLQAQDFQVRSQRLVAILAQLARLGPVIQEDLLVRGKRINWLALLQRLWRDAAGERGADTIVEDIPPDQMMLIQMERLFKAMGEGQVEKAQEQKRREGLGLGDIPKPPDLEGTPRQMNASMGA
jgi:hypothetical protein